MIARLVDELPTSPLIEQLARNCVANLSWSIPTASTSIAFRHNANPWRPGIDNVATHFGLAEHWFARELKKD